MTITESEIEEISKQMQQIRTSVGVDIHDLVENARALTDWRHYWRQHPWACCGAAIVLGYSVVPSRRFGNTDARTLATLAQGSHAKSSAAPGKRIISELAGMVLGMVVQRGMQSVVRGLAGMFQSDTASPPSSPNLQETSREPT